MQLDTITLRDIPLLVGVGDVSNLELSLAGMRHQLVAQAGARLHWRL